MRVIGRSAVGEMRRKNDEDQVRGVSQSRPAQFSLRGGSRSKKLGLAPTHSIIPNLPRSLRATTDGIILSHRDNPKSLGPPPQIKFHSGQMPVEAGLT